jgi:hypothetical protein
MIFSDQRLKVLSTDPYAMQREKCTTELETEHFDDNLLTGISKHELNVPSLNVVIDSMGKGTVITWKLNVVKDVEIKDEELNIRIND